MMFLTEMRHPQAGWTAQLSSETAFAPALELFEGPERYRLTVELPGVDPASVELTLTDGELTLKGSKPASTVEGEGTWHLRETSWGEFERTFTFPTPVAADGVQAQSRHGVLTVTVAKAPEAISRKIPISFTE